MTDDRLWTIDDLAAWAQVHRKTVAEWVSAGRVPFTTLASQTVDGRPSTRLVRFTDEHRKAIAAMGERLPIETHAAQLLDAIGAARPQPNRRTT